MTNDAINCGPRTLRLPCFFASVSSVKTNFPPFDYITFLEQFGYPNYLVSAYDLKFQDSGIPPSATRTSVILLDSGNYEAFWLRDKSWTQETYLKIIQTIDADLFCSFDDPWGRFDSQQFQRIETSRSVPIIHGDPNSLPEVVSDTARKVEASLIGIPERELGDGILQRALTLQRIHTKLVEGSFPHQIHLLGTGNPLSILLYVACGAVSFDGLEWCQTAVDHTTAKLMHFSQRELTDCECPACRKGGSYSAVTLGHNLLFYLNWMEKIRAHIETDSLINLLAKYFAPNLIKSLGFV